jgi:hypothetical protein
MVIRACRDGEASLLHQIPFTPAFKIDNNRRTDWIVAGTHHRKWWNIRNDFFI